MYLDQRPSVSMSIVIFHAVPPFPAWLKGKRKGTLHLMGNKQILIGGLEHVYFSIYWEFHHPN